MKWIAELLLMGLAMLIGCYLVPGVTVTGFWDALVAAVLIALANASIGLILRVFTLPINFITLGLVSFIISVLMILLVDYWMTSFNTAGFFSAAVLAIVVTLVRMLLNGIFGLNKKD